jgi:hypothetical protein
MADKRPFKKLGAEMQLSPSSVTPKGTQSSSEIRENACI